MQRTAISEKIRAFWGASLSYIKENEPLKLALTTPKLNQKDLVRSMQQIGFNDLLRIMAKFIYRIYKCLTAGYLKGRFYSDQNRNIFISATTVHRSVAEQWGHSISSSPLQVISSSLNRFGILKDLFNGADLSDVQRGLKQFSFAGRIQKTYFLFNYLCERLVAEVYTYELIEQISHLQAERVICLELGFAAFAARNVSKRTGLKAEYIQHGFHDLKIPFIETGFYKINDLWDLELLSAWVQNSSASQVLRGIHPLSRPPVKTGYKVALIALEYETPQFSGEEMIQWWNSVIGILSKKNIQVLLRPHPRDISSWYHGISSATIVDTRVSLEMQLADNQVDLFFTIGSASMLEATQQGVLSFYKADARNSNICCPFKDLAVPLKSSQQLVHFFERGEIENINENTETRSILYSPASLHLFTGPFISIAQEISRSNPGFKQSVILNYTQEYFGRLGLSICHKLLESKVLDVYVSHFGYEISETGKVLITPVRDLIEAEKLLESAQQMVQRPQTSTRIKSRRERMKVNAVLMGRMLALQFTLFSSPQSLKSTIRGWRFFARIISYYGRSFGLVPAAMLTTRFIFRSTVIWYRRSRSYLKYLTIPCIVLYWLCLKTLRLVRNVRVMVVRWRSRLSEKIYLAHLVRWARRVRRNKVVYNSYLNLFQKLKISDLIVGSDQGEVDNLMQIKAAEQTNKNVFVVSICEIEKIKPELRFNHLVVRVLESVLGRRGQYISANTWRGNIIGTYARNATILTTTKSMKENILAGDTFIANRVRSVAMPLAPITESDVALAKNFINWIPGDRVVTFFTENLATIYGSRYDILLFEKIKPALNRLVQKGFKVCIKFHPHESEDMIAQVCALFAQAGYYCTVDINYLAFVELSELCIAHFSRVLIEAVLRDKSIISINFNDDLTRTFLKGQFKDRLEVHSVQELNERLNELTEESLSAASYLRFNGELKEVLRENVALTAAEVITQL